MDNDVLYNMNAFVMAQFSFWRARNITYQALLEEYNEINNARPWAFIFRVRGNEVSLADKPAEQNADIMMRGRARYYLEFFNQVLRTYPIMTDFDFLVDMSDGAQPHKSVPIFTFQKSLNNTVLLPDIDFLGGVNFYEAPEYKDNYQFIDKVDRAIFVGSTSGAVNTFEVVKYAKTPRLDAAEYFKDKDDIEIRLPVIAQTADPEAIELLKQKGFGSGERISWKKQLTRKFLISIDGNGATCSRVAIALKSNSVLLKYNSLYSLYYFPALIPYRHFIPITNHSDIEDVVEAEKRLPGLYAEIAYEGALFFQRYLTRAAVSLYMRMLFTALIDTFPIRVNDGYVSKNESVVSSGPLLKPIYECMAHIQDRGDVWSTGSEYVGHGKLERRIEGIVIIGEFGKSDLRYEVRLQDETLSGLCAVGEYCGTRGENRGISGFRVEFELDFQSQFECSYWGIFSGSDQEVMANGGNWCESPFGASHYLVAFRVEIVSVVGN